MNVEQLGLIGIFLGGAIPWIEAIAVIPSGILLGLDPTWVVIAASVGNILTIFLFAYSGSQIRSWLLKRREARGKLGESKRFARAQEAFNKWGVFGMAFLGPILIGTQFAAAISVAAGVKPLKTSLIISTGMVVWAGVLALVMVSIGADQFLEIRDGN